MTSQLPNPLSGASLTDPALIAASIDRLRAEVEAAEAPTQQALLRHELGILEEAAGEEAAAARSLLAAINADAEFREPLEQMLALVQRRDSTKNLGKLLDRLVKVASTTEERTRASLERAAHLADRESDDVGAREELELALELQPDDATLWLALELVAARSGDLELRRRALERRAELTTDATWKALLELSLVQLALEAQDIDDALARASATLERGGPTTWLALSALERLATVGERHDVLAEALERRAQLILRTLQEPELADTLGIPRGRRELAAATDAWLRAATAHRARGDVGAAITLLDFALSHAPGEPSLLQARLSAADVVGDTDAATRLARQLLEARPDGALAAAYAMRLTEAAVSTGDAAEALAAAQRTLALEPTSAPPRALALDLLAGGADPTTRATLLESSAEACPTEPARARFFQLAADAWARGAGDTAGARAALSQAGMYGAPPGVVARTSRLLATLTGDATWYEEATRRLLTTNASEPEATSLWLELAASRAGRGDHAGTLAAFDALAQSSDGSWLGRGLIALLQPLLPLPEGAAPHPRDALLGFAELEPSPTVRRALELLVALHAPEPAATEQLRALHQQAPADLVIATLLSARYRARGDDTAAAHLLSATAAAVDETVRASLELEAAVSAWRGGQRAEAVQLLAALEEPSAAPVLAWALRAQDPDSLASRRRVLEAAAARGADADAAALERFALEVGEGGDAEAASDALSEAERLAATQALASAVALARGLRTSTEPGLAEAALEQLRELSPAATALVDGARVLQQLREGRSAPERLDATRRWAEADAHSVTAALAWFSCALAGGDRLAQLEALDALARRVEPALAEQVRVLHALTAQAEGEPTALVGGDSLAAKYANLELAPPGCDPRRRTRALSGLEDALGPQASLAATLLSGWNQLAAHELEGALASFRSVTTALPFEAAGWEGLRATAEALGDRRLLAECLAALGDAIQDDAEGAACWEAAATVLLDELGEPGMGEAALTRAVERDIRRFDAFDRLFRAVRARKDGPKLLALTEARLAVADDSEEIVKLYWERARVLRSSGDRAAALAALENVTLLEPDHVGALALSGEIFIGSGQFAEAAENLARLARLEDAPAQQRLMSGVAAADLYENKLGQAARGLEVLEALQAAGLTTLPVRERLARSAARLESWESAVTALELLMNERETSAQRAEAARLALAIHRDHRGHPEQAAAAVERLLTELPADGEALDLVLSGVLPEAHAHALLERSRHALVDSLVREPLDGDQLVRLAQVSERLGLAPLRQAALGALVTLGRGGPDIDQELTRLEQRVASLPQIAIDEAALPELSDPEDHGPIPALMRELASTFVEAIGPGLAAFGVGKKERVDPRVGLPLRNEVAAWAGALGLGDFDLYVGGQDPNLIVALPLEVPAVVIGAAVKVPLSPPARSQLARELFALKRGWTLVRHRAPQDIAALIVAACRLGGVDYPSPQYAMLAEFQRALSKEISRKVKKVLPELAAQVAQSRQEPLAAVAAATSSLDRLAAIAAGDVSWVLSTGRRGEWGASLEGEQRARRLLSFVLSPGYLALREKLGMGVR